MKKNIIKTLLLSFLITGFIACNENDNEENVYEGDNFISFGTSFSASTSESMTDPVTITAYASITNLQSDITVNTTITEENVSSANYAFVDGKSSFSFGPGKYVDTIKVIPVDNTDADGSKKITITLDSASDGTLIGYPGIDANGKIFTLTISDDDCALIASNFTGIASGNETITYSAGEKPSEASFVLVSSTSNTATYKVSGILGPQFTVWGEAVTSGGEFTITLDNSDPTNPSVIATDVGDPLSNGLDYFYCQTDNEWGYYLNLDSSTFSTCEKTLELAFTIDVTQASTGGVFEADGSTKLILQF